jgi:hypothetical protein
MPTGLLSTRCRSFQQVARRQLLEQAIDVGFCALGRKVIHPHESVDELSPPRAPREQLPQQRAGSVDLEVQLLPEVQDEHVAVDRLPEKIC